MNGGEVAGPASINKYPPVVVIIQCVMADGVRTVCLFETDVAVSAMSTVLKTAFDLKLS